jgi:tannase/feruloyl esterase
MARRFVLAMGVATTLFGPHAAFGATCESLASLPLSNAHVTLATTVSAGSFAVPPAAPVPSADQIAALRALPSFCRVAATLTPAADSDIKVEIWLPEPTKWNGKFQGVGNGGWAGVISYNSLAAAVAGGYATASTDTGHVGNNAAFALGHPEKLIDNEYRAVHEMTVQAKAIIAAYYGAPQKISFWNGCSAGGRQGITEALRYPADYDAIVAGAPAVNGMNLHVGRIEMNRNANKNPDAAIPPAKYPLIHNAVLASCDPLDGVKDDVLENPLACRFDPQVLQCKAGQDSSSCLTPAQVGSARAMYAGVKDPQTGRVLVPGLEPGSELSWRIIGGPTPLDNALQAGKYVFHKDPNWDFRNSTLAQDLAVAHAALPDDAFVTPTNLKPFFDRGGKLLMYHGFQDPQVPSENGLNYYRAVVSSSGKGLEGKQIALYMVPGMNHCQGGPGTDRFDKMAAIEAWVATGKAPDSIPAAHVANGKTERTRPLCQFPKVAKWNGSGSTDDAVNFSCATGTSVKATK